MKILLLLLFWVHCFLVFSARAVISPFLPIIEDELHISHAVAGGIFTFVSAGYTASLFLAGVLTPRIGCKRTIVLGFAVLATSFFSMKYTSTYFSLVGVSLFIGLGAGLYIPSAIPLITAIFKRDNWGKAIGFHQTAAPFSTFSIPILSTIALGYFHWKNFFAVLSGVCLIVMLFFWVFAPHHRPQEEKRPRFASVLGRKDFWLIVSLWIIAGAGFMGIYNVIPLFLVKEKGIQLEMANIIFGFSRGGGFFAGILGGFLVDRYGVKKILTVVLLATGLSEMGIALAQGFPSLVTMLFMQGTFCAGFFPIALVAISKITSPNERSIFTGATMAIGTFVAAGVTPVALGAVADVWDFQIGILFLGALTILAHTLVRGLRSI